MSEFAVLPSFAGGVLDVAARTLGSPAAEQDFPGQAQDVAATCRDTAMIVAHARRAAASRLEKAVEAKGFAALAAGLAVPIDAFLNALSKVRDAFAALSGPAADDVRQAVAEAEREASALKVLLTEAIRFARLPDRPVPWDKIQEAEAAFHAGQGRRVQEMTAKRRASRS